MNRCFVVETRVSTERSDNDIWNFNTRSHARVRSKIETCVVWLGSHGRANTRVG